MTADLRRFGKALGIATGVNALSAPVVGGLTTYLAFGAGIAALLTWALNNLPFYFALWAKEALHLHRRQEDRRHLGFA